MSYSRFNDSNWYVYPCTSKQIVCCGPGFIIYGWCPSQSLEEFLDEVAENEEIQPYVGELRDILEKNIDDINKCFAEWNS